MKSPHGMEGVELEEWKKPIWDLRLNVLEESSHVSVGGLSTGGVLSFYMACIKPRVTGELYLFSASLDLAGGPSGLVCDLKERLLRTFLTDVLDKDKPMIGKNPFRYCLMDLGGARELACFIPLFRRKGHIGGVSSLEFNPRRPYLATGGKDGLIKVWNTDVWPKKQTEGRLKIIPASLKSLDSDVLSVSWSYDGNQLTASFAPDSTLDSGVVNSKINHGKILSWNWDLEDFVEKAKKTIWPVSSYNE